MNLMREIEEHLRDEDAAEVCDLLCISSSDLVERFSDRIEDNIEVLKELIVHEEESDYLEE